MALALRIEASLSKREILEQYVNLAPFGEGIRGIGASSAAYLDKPPAKLSWAEAASLVGLARGPAVYSLRRHPERVLRRRDRILRRLQAAHWITEDEATRALSEPLSVRIGTAAFGAPHLVHALYTGALGDPPARDKTVETTLRRELQREAEQAARSTVGLLAGRHVTAASVVVIDNASGEVLAYVGSHDFEDSAHGGQNDGVRARRQPGSTLKPFVYGLGMERLGWHAATILPDVELLIPVPSGVYAPRNYDETFHGPVRLREALANSFNVPAVWAAEQVGISVFLERLRALGFESLTEGPETYGPALALGDGEVTLLELTDAYATLARGGVKRAVRFRRGPSEEHRVFPTEVAELLTDILQDKHARVASFGEGSALELEDVAVKTGTSKGYRDNWTVGFSPEVTVGVWVGNFDGSPMEGVSGVTGAAPLFRTVMEAARGGTLARVAMSDRFDRGEMCPLSGGIATGACPHRVGEWFPRGVERRECSMHERVRVDRRTGLRAGAACPVGVVEERRFERYEGLFLGWAHGARRGMAPTGFSPLCPGESEVGSTVLRIVSPRDGARYAVDPSRANQTVAVRVEVPEGVREVEVLVDGRLHLRLTRPFVGAWALVPGEHVLSARGGGRHTGDVRVVVE
jgi:penicillin-binding protein 1C